MSPNPVTGAAAWTLALLVDIVAVVVAAALLAWDRWCPAGTTGCPTAADRAGRDALVVVLLGGLLLTVALVALLTGRLLLAAVQVGLVVVVVLAVRQGLPEVWTHVREHQFSNAAIPTRKARA